MAADRSRCGATSYIALIPAYEPDEKMLTVVDELSRAGFRIVVVDDGSGPAYREIFDEAGRRASVISYEHNMGKGAALKTGLAYIYDYMAAPAGSPDMAQSSSHPAGSPDTAQSSAHPDSKTVVVTVDADGQHLTKDVLRIARAAAANPGSLVLGSRGLETGSRGLIPEYHSSRGSGTSGTRGDHSACDERGRAGSDRSSARGERYSAGSACSAGSGDIPLRSRLGNTITRHVFRISTGLSIHDTQTGLRAFSADLIPRMLKIDGSRYEYEINMLLDLAASGMPVREERIETVYIDNNSSSHFDAVRDSCRVYREILKFSASSLIGFAVDYIMFALLSLVTPGIGLANIGARLVSSVTNYTINRKFVFGSNRRIGTSALQYFALAAVILAGNTVVLKTLVETFGINSLLAKVATELMFFIISWTVQRYLIFYRDESCADEADTDQQPLTEQREAAVSDDGKVRFIVEHRAVRVPKLRAVRAGRAERLPVQRTDTGKETGNRWIRINESL